MHLYGCHTLSLFHNCLMFDFVCDDVPNCVIGNVGFPKLMTTDW